MKNKITNKINGYEVKVNRTVTYCVRTMQEVLEVLGEQDKELEVYI